jgi:hypothetical protein
VLTLHTRIQRAADLLATEVDGDRVMLSLRTNKYYGMKEIGGRIWDLLENPITPDALIEELVAEYAVDRETCERDTLHFLEHLHREQLIDVQP